MFTGIVERTGTVHAMEPVSEGARLILALPEIAADLTLGESVAVNGCCLTVAAFPGHGTVRFDLLAETLRVTNLGELHPGSLLNIERALRVGDRLSGHFVQGHVDARAEILVWEAIGQDHRLVVRLPESFARYTIPRGSVTVDGMSLTIADLEPDRFTIWITPHTHAVTNLQTRKAGETVNLEFDVLAKYVDRQRNYDLSGAPGNG